MPCKFVISRPKAFFEYSDLAKFLFSIATNKSRSMLCILHIRSSNDCMLISGNLVFNFIFLFIGSGQRYNLF